MGSLATPAQLKIVNYLEYLTVSGLDSSPILVTSANDSIY